jgi:DNA-directed RNA polymerase beta' subunit
MSTLSYTFIFVKGSVLIMKIDLLDMDTFIKRNKCPEIKNSILFNFGNKPTEDGLLSIELFGQMGSDDRKNIFGYIDLKKKYLHPLVYKILISMNRKLSQCINGTKYFKLNGKGEIIEAPEDGETGIKFLYDNWDNIKWKASDSFTRNDKITILTKKSKNELFIDKFLVMPPFIRDFTPTDNNERVDAVDSINDLYSKLIRYCQSSDDFSFSFLSYNNDALIQDLLVEIYDYCTSQLAKKTGLIHRSLLGKSIDYATRSVISCPQVNSQTWKTTQVRFGETGVPLSQVITIFFPFFVYEIQSWFETRLDQIKDEAKLHNTSVDHFMDNFDEEHIKKLMNTFIKNHEARFDKISFKDDTGTIRYLSLYKNELKRDFTLTDLLYIVAIKVVENKHVYVTRYPITNFHNIYPSRIKVLSTQKTCKMTLGNDYFEEYPLILEEYPEKSKNGQHDYFVDTCRINSYYLAAMGGDFDGDTVSIRGVFTQEANAEAEELINSKNYLLNVSGGTSRTVKNEAIQAIYSMTY